MRLIDANRIEFNTVRYPIGAPWPPNKEKQATMGEIEWVSKHQIENQSTVEAIPIEWINKWTKQFFDDKGAYHGEGYDTIWDLLEDWEKEHD